MRSSFLKRLLSSFSHMNVINKVIMVDLLSSDQSTWTINRETQTVICSGDCPDNQIAHDLLYYVDMVKKEVDSCTNLLTEMRDNSLIVRRVESNLTGPFTKGDFKLTVNAKKIIGLLGSENVYGDERAFLTELIQNSVDAILVRANLDSRFEVNDGRIDIYIWEDDEYVYARIDDNGIGMDKNIIESYFLAIGESYYNSYEFKKIIREGKVKFTPMNRFGIGLLSCFMGEEASMQVETKHVRGGIVYRMDITSLEGFYSLYEVDRSSKVNPLLRPNNSVMGGYNRQIGSSICVKKKKNTKDLEKGEDEIIIENVKGNSKKYHYIVYLSLKYNIYINIDSEDRNYISGHFNMTDYVCENDIFYEYGIPAVYIDGNDDVLTWNQWINRNNVLIKWIEQHEESLIKEPDFNHIMFALRHPINHISWSHYFRELIGVIMKNNHYLFDEDLIKYIDIIDSEKSINQVIIASEEDFC